jgi:hypothetical protein
MNPWGVVNAEIWSLVHIPRDAGLGIPNTIARIPLASSIARGSASQSGR